MGPPDASAQTGPWIPISCDGVDVQVVERETTVGLNTRLTTQTTTYTYAEVAHPVGEVEFMGQGPLPDPCTGASPPACSETTAYTHYPTTFVQYGYSTSAASATTFYRCSWAVEMAWVDHDSGGMEVGSGSSSASSISADQVWYRTR